MSDELRDILEDIRLLCSYDDSGAHIRDYISLLTGQQETWQRPNREYLDFLIDRARRDEAIEAARIARLKYAIAAEDLREGYRVVLTEDKDTTVRLIERGEQYDGTIWQGDKKGEVVSYYEPVEGEE